MRKLEALMTRIAIDAGGEGGSKKTRLATCEQKNEVGEQLTTLQTFYKRFQLLSSVVKS